MRCWYKNWLCCAPIPMPVCFVQSLSLPWLPEKLMLKHTTWCSRTTERAETNESLVVQENKSKTRESTCFGRGSPLDQKLITVFSAIQDN